MRRVAFRISFETLDRRENPGTSWGVFSLFGAVSSLLDHSHAKSKAKPTTKADHAAISTTVSAKDLHPSVTHPAHAEHAPSNHPVTAKTTS